MNRPSKRLLASAVVALLSSTAVSACSSSVRSTVTQSPAATPRSSDARPPAHGSCQLGPKLVPQCGVLWGVATKPPTERAIKDLESALGRTFDFVYRYHDVNQVIPDSAEGKLVAGGRILHIAIAARDFTSLDRASVTWAQIAAGRFDASLSRQARGIASLNAPVFVTFEQEANQKQKLGVLGTAGDFKAAWRHLHDLYAKAGATNVAWVWVMTGSQDNLSAAGTLWPGNDVVDWVSWNVYNQSGCAGGEISASKYVSFENKMLIFYNWMHDQGPAVGMDATKPIMISEVGSAQYADDPQRSADWYAQIPATLQKYPQIKAVALWASIDRTCDYRFQDNAVIARGVASASSQPLVNAVRIPNPR